MSSSSPFRHPKNGAKLEVIAEEKRDGKIVTGYLEGGGDRFPIVNGVARFCPPENYTQNFGYQWEHFSQTQLDSRSRWNRWSETRLFKETKWPREMKSERILEAGSGMGRFTEILARTGAEIHSFDFSSAIDANFNNNSSSPNVTFAQADLYSPPYERRTFDKVLCLGVIQHCPKPEAAFRSLVEFLKPGGQIVIDVYRLSFKSIFMGKYYLRPFTKRLSPSAQHAFVKRHMAWSYPFTGLIHRRLGLRPGYYASMLLGLADFRGVQDIASDFARELSELDTLDMLGPRYDRPQLVRTVRRWFERAGLEQIEVHPGYNGIEGRGRLPG
jgi:2-polyprenyl-3-methyl-5-hydroxy-6-metoxy-1,4-benzoquinol methylase